MGISCFAVTSLTLHILVLVLPAGHQIEDRGTERQFPSSFDEKCAVILSCHTCLRSQRRQMESLVTKGDLTIGSLDSALPRCRQYSKFRFLC